jgi:hypothetical protein
MSAKPPQVVFDAFNAATSRMHRRMEVYETDGVTPWKPTKWGRLVDGTVTLDYGRDERRNLDLVIDNTDGEFNHSSSNFWYDKVIKIFYGIDVNQVTPDPNILIMEEYGVTGEALNLKAILIDRGFNSVRINTAATTTADVSYADILVSISSDYSRKQALLNSAFAAGQSVLTISPAATSAQLPNHISTTAASTGPASAGAPTLTVSTTGGTLAAAANYNYRIVVRNSIGTTLAGPEAATSATTTGTTSSITVTWAAVSGAASYDVYGRTAAGELYLGNVAGTTYADTGSTVPSGALPTSNTSVTGLTSSVKSFSPFAYNTQNRLTPPFSSGWAAYNAAAQTTLEITGVPATAIVGSYSTVNGNPDVIGFQQYVGTGVANWIHVNSTTTTLNDTTTNNTIQSYAMFGAITKWLVTFVPVKYWECQIGEFVIDSISDESSDYLMKITCRDYVKRCITSKLTQSTALIVGDKVEDTIKTNAINSGINKFRLPGSTRTITHNVVHDRQTTRWSIMKELATSIGHELFFDGEGYLVMRPFQDPLLTPANLNLTTGPVTGNLIKVGRKVSDALLFNHIVAYGQSSDVNKPPVFAEASNTITGSPSAIAKIGDRPDFYTSPLLITTADCQVVANQMLKIAALEEFEVSFDAIIYPWLEAGDIVEFFYSRFAASEVFRFLLSTLSLPLNLNPMTGTSKRVVIVL